MDRTQFTFFESFYQSISGFKKKSDQADAYNAICKYALYGIEPDVMAMPEIVRTAFVLIKPNLIASRKKAENGRRGGNKTKANDKQNESKAEANDKQNESKKEKEYKKEKEKEKEHECIKEKEKKSFRFSAPSLDEVKAYCLERGNGVDAERFVDFYAAKGWKVGNQPMKDWKAAVRTWEKRENDGNQPNQNASNGPTAEYMKELEKIKDRIRGENHASG